MIIKNHDMENVTKSVHVFFGGATNLEAERDLVNSVANELSSKYDKDGIHVVVSSFKTLGDNQEVYHKFLKDDADVAIFVIKDGFYKYTKSELKTALEEYRKEGRPNLHVFRCTDLGNPKSVEIAEELSGMLAPQHAVQYKDHEELRSLVRDRITDVIKKQMQKDQIQGSRGRSLWGWVAALAIFLASLIYWSIENNRQMPVFVGGGSVTNFIRETWGTDLDKYSHSINIHLPSGTAYTVIGEEGNRDNKSYVPIVLSAGYVKNDSVFTKVCKEDALRKKLMVYEYWLGRDSLMVFVSSHWLNNHPISSGIDSTTNQPVLTGKQLYDLLEKGLNSRVDIYRTSPNSGTLNAFKDVLQCIDTTILDNKKLKEFHENNPTEKNDRIFLGSKYFQPKNERENKDVSQYTKFMIHKRDGDTKYEGNLVYKDMFVYFPAYGSGVYRVPKCIIDFFKRNPSDKEYPQSLYKPYDGADDVLINRDKRYEAIKNRQ